MPIPFTQQKDTVENLNDTQEYFGYSHKVLLLWSRENRSGTLSLHQGHSMSRRVAAEERKGASEGLDSARYQISALLQISSFC